MLFTWIFMLSGEELTINYNEPLKGCCCGTSKCTSRRRSTARKASIASSAK